MGEFKFNKEIAEYRKKKFVFNENTVREAQERRQKSALEEQKKREERNRLANFQSNNKAMDFFLADKRPELKTAGANEVNRLAKEYADFLEKEAYFLNMDIPAQKKVLEDRENTLKQLEDLQSQYANTDTLKKRVESDIKYKESAGWDTSHDKGLLDEYNVTLEDIRKQMDSIGSVRMTWDEVNKLKGDIKYAEFKQGGKKLTDFALSAEDFETSNAYGKDGLFRDDAVEQFLDAFPDLNTNYRWEDNEFFTAMNEQEKKILGYYLGHKEYGLAAQYVNYLRETVGNKIAEQHRKDADTWYEKLGYAFMSGGDMFRQGIQGLGNAIVGNDGYTPPSPIQQGSSMIRQDIEDAEGLGNRILGGAYDVTSTTVNMLPSIALSIASPTAGAVLMGTTAGGNAYTQMINEGGTWAQAVGYGALVGTSEAVLERILGGIVGKEKIVGVLMPKLKKTASKVALKIGEDVISEFSEEALQTVLEPLFESWVTNTDYEAPEFEDVMYSGLLGAITGGMFTGGGIGGKSIANTVIERVQNAQIQSDLGESILNFDTANEDIKKLIDNAQQSGDKKLQKAANKVAKTEKDGAYDVSARKVGRLAQMSKEQLAQSLMDTATGNDLKSQTIEKLTKSGMNQKGAERAFDLIARDASRGSESKELQSLINKNPDIRTMYDNMVEYLSDEAVTKRVEDVAKASPVTEITNRITDQRLKDAGIDVVDESGDIDNIDSVVNVDEFGNYVLKRESGETVTYDPSSYNLPNVDASNADKVSFATELFGLNGAQTYVKLAPDNASVEYKSAFHDLYNQGNTNKAFTQIDADISLEAQKAIYEAGNADFEAAKQRKIDAEKKAEAAEKAAKEKEASFVKKEMGFKSDRVTVSDAALEKLKAAKKDGKGKQYEAAIKVIENLAKMLQVNINIVASETDANGNYISENGMYNRATNTFTFDIMSGMDNVAEISYTAMVKTAGHELTHFIQNWSPSKYLTLKNTTLKFLTEEHSERWIEQQLKQIKADNKAIGKNLTLEQAKDELVADAFEDVLSNIDFAETILRTDKTLFDKIHSWVKKHANDFKKNLGIALKDVEAQTEAGKTMKKAGERAQALYNQWADAFSTALENSTSGQTDVDEVVQNKARPSKRDPRYLDPRTITENDVRTMLENASFGEYNDDTYIPLRRNTPRFFIDVVSEHSKGTYIVKDFPIAATAKHIRQNIEMVDGQSYGEERPHELEIDDIITISEKMSDPAYIVLQSNGRYVEVVTFYNKRKKQVIVAIDIANDHTPPYKNFKYTQYMNGYDEGYYNIVVSQYEADNFKSYLANNEVVYDKKEMNGKYQVGSGRIVTVTHDNPFIEDTISQKNESVKEKFSEDIDYSARRRNKNHLDVESRFGVAESVSKYAETVSDPALKAKLKANATTYAKKLDEYETESIRYDNATANGWDEMAATAYYAMTMAKTVINQIETDADFALSLETAVGAFENYSEETRKQYQEKYKKAIAESKDKVAYIRNEMRAMQRDISDSERKAKEFAQREKKANYRAKQIELRNQRDRYMSFLSKEKTRIKTALEKPSETASVPKDTQEIAKKLIGVIDSFNKFNNSSALTKSSAELIEKIVSIANAEMEAGRSKSLVQKTNATDKVLLGLKLSFDQVRSSLDALVAEYEKLSPEYTRKDGEKAPSAAAAIVYDEQLHNALKELAKDFSAPELVFEHGLSYVYEGIKVIRAMNHQLLKANQMYVKGKSVEVLKLRNMLLQDVKMASPFLNKFLGNALVSNVLMPKTMLHIVFGATENADIFYDMLDDGQMRYIRFMNGAREIFSPVEKEIENEKFKSDKPTLKTGLKYMDGTDVLLNYEFALSFIKIVENEDSLRHAVWGGLQIPDLVPYNKGDKSAYNSKRLVEHAQPEYAPDAMTDEQIAKTLEKASEEGRTITDQEYLDMYAQQIVWNNRQNLAKEIEAKYKAAALMLKDQMSKTETGKKALTMLSLMTRYYDQYARKYLNEATMELYGFEKTLQEGKTYYPIRVRKDEKASDDNVDIVRDFALENWGSMKHRVNSKKGIELYGALTELESYMENTAKFYAWTTVTKNMKKILNTQIIDDNGTVTTLVGKVNQLYGSYDPNVKGVKNIKNKFMSGFEQYMKDLQTEIIGANKGGEKWAKLQGAFVTNALLLNISTPLVQYSATPLVAVDSGYLSFIKTVAKGGKIPALLSEAQKQYVAKYSEVYRYRSSGLINVDLAAAKANKGVVSKALSSKALAWTESADAQVLGKQFYALLDHVKRTHKGISAEEAARIAGKQLDQTIYDFQANYTVLQRAPVLRGSGIKKLLFGTFRTQQITLLNAMIDSSVRSHTLSEQMKQVKKDSPEYKALERKRSDSKKRTAKIHLAIALSNALNAFIRMGVGFIRRKDDDEKGETAFIDFLDSYLSMIPLFGDIASAIVSIASGRMFYGEKVFSLGMLDTLSDSITSVAEIAGMLFDDEDQELSEYIKELTNVLAVSGVPARNIYNIIKMIMGWAEDAADAAGWDWDLDVDEW